MMLVMPDGRVLNDAEGPDGPLPLAVWDAVVRVCGESFHWRRSVLTAPRRAGVAQHAVDRYDTSGMGKFLIARTALDELNRSGRRGWIVQRRLVAELANMSKPEEKAPDQRAGQEALAELKRVAFEAELLVNPNDLERRRRKEAARREREQLSRRTQAIADLNALFTELNASDKNEQARGYGLERLHRELFRINELDYTGSYKTETDQIDGGFWSRLLHLSARSPMEEGSGDGCGYRRSGARGQSPTRCNPGPVPLHGGLSAGGGRPLQTSTRKQGRAHGWGRPRRYSGKPNLSS